MNSVQYIEVEPSGAPVPCYRAFRQRYVAAEARETRTRAPYIGRDEHAPEPHPLSVAKRNVRSARATLLNELEYHPERLARDRRHALRLLGVPEALDVPHAWWRTLGYGLMDLFMPTEAVFAWLHRYFAPVRTFEGRTFLMLGPLRGLAPRNYWPGRDFVIRHVRGRVDSERLKELEHRPARWLATLHRLGCESVAELVAETRELGDADARVVVQVLCRAGVLISLDELRHWPELKKPAYGGFGRHDESDDRRERNVEAVVRRLLSLGAERRAIVSACQARGEFNAIQLAETVAELKRSHVSPALVLEAVGNLLWTAQTDRWRFLMDELHLRHPADFALFSELLKSRGDLPTELARAILASGAGVAELAACQPVLLRASNQSEPGDAVRVWEELTRPPFSMAATDFARVREYLRKPQRLSGFLTVLKNHGLIAADAVLAFDECFASVDEMSLASLLQIALPRQGNESLANVANWVRRAHVVGSYNACATLVGLVAIPQLPDLERALKLLPINADVLRYLVVDKRLSTLSGLLKWFQTRANGILDMKLHGRVGMIERLLLDDAFKRTSFLSVRHNVESAIGALGLRAENQLGPRPHFDEAAARNAYDAQYEVVRTALVPALLLDMTRLLDSTSGLLFESFLAEIDAEPAAFERRLAAISPLIDQLVAGRGPAQDPPSQVEIEAIGLVYGVDPRNVSLFWKDVVGRESDVAALKLASSYPMWWKRERRDLRPDATLDDRGFSTLSKLAGLARQFNQVAAQDMELARIGLRPSRVEDEAADVSGMSTHLAVVCALLAADTNVATMLGRWESAHAAIAGGQAALQLIEQTQSFFAAALPDAVAQELSARLEGLGDVAARQLAERLAPKNEKLAANPPREHLKRSVEAVVSKLQVVYGTWAKRQRDMFSPSKDGEAVTELVAVVSKTPAAFFAKFAAALCTKADTEMWNEDRHSHLVVFDLGKRRLVGMAMLYVEDVAAIDEERRTLVIRAINPMTSVATEHDVASMVDAYLAVAIEIARTNGFAAVAMPGDDSHLLSNVDAVRSNVWQRFVRPSVATTGSGRSRTADGRLATPWTVATTFDGYAKGKGRVSALHVIWMHPALDSSVGPRIAIAVKRS